VYDYYTQEETVPAVKKLLPKLRETIHFKAGGKGKVVPVLN
jgi:hypothetical protein